MANPANKIVKLEFPRSESNSDWADYEYMLVWFGTKADIHQYLFYDRRVIHSPTSDQINLDDSDLIGNILRNEEVGIELVAEDLTRQRYDYVRSITRSKDAWRLYKDGTYEKVSVQEIPYEFDELAQRHEFPIRLNELNKRVQM